MVVPRALSVLAPPPVNTVTQDLLAPIGRANPAVCNTVGTYVIALNGCGDDPSSAAAGGLIGPPPLTDTLPLDDVAKQAVALGTTTNGTAGGSRGKIENQLAAPTSHTDLGVYSQRMLFHRHFIVGSPIVKQCYHCFSTAARRRTREDGSNLVVAILGPPNAGKSTLFNRLMCKEANRTYRLNSEKIRGRRSRRIRATSHSRVGYSNPTNRIDGAIVSPLPGTTRDRRECVGRIGGTVFTLVDTAGVDGERLVQLHRKKFHYNHIDKHVVQQRWLEKACVEQTLKAAKDADLILLMFDARVGVTSDLLEISLWLRKLSCVGADKAARIDDNPLDDHDIPSTPKAVVILANKLEGDRWSVDNNSSVLDHLAEVQRAGFGDAIPISAEHGEGLADLAVIIHTLTKQKHLCLQRDRTKLTNDDLENRETSDENSKKPLTLAILGRQNVGKSTLVNSLLKQDRVITGEMPGLTRDAIAIQWEWDGKLVQIADTAGIRRLSQRNNRDNIEDAAVYDAMRAMKKSDVAVLVLDAGAQVLHRQELAIANAVLREGRSLVVAANKMDLLVDDTYGPEDFAREVQGQIEIRFPMLRKTPVVAMSSLTGENVDHLMPVVFKARDRWSRTITTGLLNSWLTEVVGCQPPPKEKGRATKIKYIMQTKGRPPTFLLFSNQDSLPESYVRYLTRSFQDTFEMFGMEVRLVVKRSSTSNPFDNGKKRQGRSIGGHEARKQRLFKELRATGTVTRNKGKRLRYTKRRFS